MPNPGLTDAGVLTFVVLGFVTTTQQLASIASDSMPSADPGKIFEETACLTGTATARAVSTGFDAGSGGGAPFEAAILTAPHRLAEYMNGYGMLATGTGGPDQVNEVHARLERARSFYEVHLPAGQFPDRKQLNEKMALWMGRISPRGLDELPTTRLDRLDLVKILHTHCRLVEAYVRNGVQD